MFRRHHFRLRQEVSGLYDQHSFYAALDSDLRSARKTVLIESPFLTIKRTEIMIRRFNELRRRKVEVKIYTRLPEHHNQQMAAESRAAIALLRAADVRVFMCADMRHRKIAIIDHEVLWDGSLNIMSQSKSCEMMRRTVSKQQCRSVMSLTRITSNKW